MSAPAISPRHGRDMLKLEIETAHDGDAMTALTRTLLSDAEIDELPETNPLIEGIAFEEQLITVIGKYATYKTFLLLDFALCIALGLDWNGHRVRQGPVIYVYAEGATGIKKRRNAWKAAHGYTDYLPIHYRPTRLNVCDPAQVMLLVREIQSMGITPIAVFIDTVARNMRGVENDGKDMKLFVEGCDTLRETLHVAVFLAHHTGWEATRSRGSTELPGAADTEIFLERIDDQVTLKCTKQKEDAEFAPITLEAFSIAGSLVLKPVVPTSAKLTANERVALNVVQNSDGLSSTEWEDSTGLAKGSYNNARKRLLILAYVKKTRAGYSVTESGRQALGTTDKTGTTQVQATEPRQVQHILLPKGENVVLGHGQDGANA